MGEHPLHRAQRIAAEVMAERRAERERDDAEQFAEFRRRVALPDSDGSGS